MDSYEILGVSRNDSITEIKETFRKKAKKYHPDKGGDTNTFIQLKEAYEKVMKEKKDEMQPDTTSIIADLLKHHYLLERFFTLLDGEVPENRHHWTV